MKVKRYRAETTQQAMAMVRAELGNDAVLISNKRVAGQVEVLAASEFDPQEVKQKYDRLTAANSAAQVQASVSEELLKEQRKEQRTERQKAQVKERVKEFPFELLADMDLEREKELLRQKEIRREQEKQIAEEKGKRLRQEKEIAEEKEKLLQREQEVQAQSQSLRQMQEELGRLRKLFEGEMAQLAWRESHSRRPNRVALLSRLEMAGINHDLAAQLVDKILPCDDVEQAWQKIINLVPRALKKPAPDPLMDGGVIAMVGSTGVGKTTTAVKMAARFAEQNGRNQVALITTDDFRVGQREQLLSLGSSMGLSVQVAANEQEMQQALDCFAERKLVIVDTAGINQRRQDFNEHLVSILNSDRKINPYLVLSATVQESVINDTVRACAGLNPVSAIVTKTDENVSIGAVLSALIRFRLPVSYVGTGQGIPEDFARADGEFFKDRIKDSYQQTLVHMQKRRKATA